MEYAPYGEPLITESGASNVRQRFNGKELDETALSFYGARYADPLLGRWIGRDPIATSDPTAAVAHGQSATLFAFSSNNPVARIDSDGRADTPTTIEDPPTDPRYESTVRGHNTSSARTTMRDRPPKEPNSLELLLRLNREQASRFEENVPFANRSRDAFYKPLGVSLNIAALTVLLAPTVLIVLEELGLGAAATGIGGGGPRDPRDPYGGPPGSPYREPPQPSSPASPEKLKELAKELERQIERGSERARKILENRLEPRPDLPSM